MTLLWLIGGGLVAGILFASQQRTVKAVTPAPSARIIPWFIAGVGFRLLIVLGLFGLAMPYGIKPVLVGLLGFWLTRWILLLWAIRPGPESNT